jgi:hypothetical protein
LEARGVSAALSLPRSTRKGDYESDEPEWIESLVIPPAWRDVRISLRTNAKLQATRIDSAGRRQYLYHPDFRAAQERIKFDKLIHFAEQLPELRTAMSEHMEAGSLERERIAAIAVRLLNLGWFRVGSERYAKTYKTFGITTLGRQHVAVRAIGPPSAIAARVAHAYAPRWWTPSWPTRSGSCVPYRAGRRSFATAGTAIWSTSWQRA